eukprot:350383-Chlamydomonas_euryale.AAC.2
MLYKSSQPILGWAQQDILTIPAAQKYSLYMSDIASHDLCGDLTAMAERFHIEAENIAAVEVR